MRMDTHKLKTTKYTQIFGKDIDGEVGRSAGTDAIAHLSFLSMLLKKLTMLKNWIGNGRFSYGVLEG